jgi:REP element-mobilizing transposase RayT
MSNHFHLVVRPIADSDLSRWMHWLMTAHVRRYLNHYRHSGHVNAPMTEAECEAIRLSIRRNRPYGTESWTRSTAARLGLLCSLRSPGDQGAADPGIAPNA